MGERQQKTFCKTSVQNEVRGVQNVKNVNGEQLKKLCAFEPLCENMILVVLYSSVQIVQNGGMVREKRKTLCLTVLYRLGVAD